MMIASLFPFLLQGLICTGINNWRQKQQNYLRTAPYLKANSVSQSPQNNDNDKTSFLKVVRSLYNEASIFDIATTGSCFNYKNANGITLSYDVRSPYLVIDAIDKSQHSMSQEDLKERILSNDKEAKKVFVSIVEKDKRKIQIAIPVSMTNSTAFLKDTLSVVEDTIRQKEHQVVTQTTKDFRFYIKTQGAEEGPFSAQEMSEMTLADMVQVREESVGNTWFPANYFDFDELAQEERETAIIEGD